MSDSPGFKGSNTSAAVKRTQAKNHKVSRDSASKTVVSKGKFADKYKYVRFVEKKKVLRKMRQLQQSLMTGNSEAKDEVEAKLANLRKDLLYIDKFPGNQKYISLFPEGELSEDCRKKQMEIRAMIINLTKLNEEKAEKRKLDVIERDDFFASVNNVDKKPCESSKSENATPLAPGRKQKAGAGSKRDAVVHPSWDAKKHNEKLTGSLASTKFEGSRVVFDEEN
jgi:hypothetical protein